MPERAGPDPNIERPYRAVMNFSNKASCCVTPVGAALEVVLGVALGVAVGLLVDDVQPLIETRTREPIKSNGNAYLSGV